MGQSVNVRHIPPLYGGGGGTGGTWSWDPGSSPWIRGSIYKKKVLEAPGPNTHTAATIRKEFLTPPPPHPPPQKRGTQVREGGYGAQNPRNHWGIIFGPKMMILQRVGRQKPYIGVCYANDPKKGGYTTLAFALDPTTSLRCDFLRHLRGLVFPMPFGHMRVPCSGGGDCNGGRGSLYKTSTLKAEHHAAPSRGHHRQV